MKCSKCGAEFEGKFCSECGTPANVQPDQAPPSTTQPPIYQSPAVPQKKKGGCLKGGLIALGAIVLIALIANLAGGDDGKPTVASQAQSSTVSADVPPSSKPEQPEQTVFEVNQPVQKNDVELTVTKVEKSNGTDYDKPKSGMEFVIVTVKYKNIGSKDTVSYNPYDFKIKNSKGQITSQSFTLVNTDTALSSGDLAPGGEIEGTIAFEQPADDAALVLQYTGNIFKTDSEIDFKLN